MDSLLKVFGYFYVALLNSSPHIQIITNVASTVRAHCAFAHMHAHTCTPLFLPSALTQYEGIEH